MITAATCFSGIGAPEQAAPGWSWLWHAEIEPFPAAVMAARHPGSVNLGDVLAADFLERVASEPLDVLVGGPPCQAFSVAGLRGGLADPRGNLSLRWVQIIHAARPRYAVTENVPGWLSSADNAFGCYLGALVGGDDAIMPPTGFGWPGAGMVAGPLMRAAWRVLDAQYFGLAQRRRRVFAVACPADGGDPSEILFERASLRRDTAKGRGERQNPAGGTVSGTLGSNHGNIKAEHAWTGQLQIAHSLRADGFDASEDGVPVAFMDKESHSSGNNINLSPTMRTGDCARISVAYGGNNTAGPIDVAVALLAHGTRRDFESETFVAQAFDARQSDVIQYGDMTGPLDTDPHTIGVAFHENGRAELTLSDTAGSLTVGGGKPGQGYPATLTATRVRRLLPEECERLQGFPDGYTAIDFRSKPPADGPRYRALGNSMAVPCLRWILRRIEAQAATARQAA